MRARSGLVFDTGFETKYDRALRKIGIDPACCPARPDTPTSAITASARRRSTPDTQLSVIPGAPKARGKGIQLAGEAPPRPASLDPLPGATRRRGRRRGWGAGQLETEINENGWLHCEPDPELVFDTGFETKYDRALRKIGIDPAMLSSQAGHA